MHEAQGLFRLAQIAVMMGSALLTSKWILGNLPTTLASTSTFSAISSLASRSPLPPSPAFSVSAAGAALEEAHAVLNSSYAVHVNGGCSSSRNQSFVVAHSTGRSTADKSGPAPPLAAATSAGGFSIARRECWGARGTS